MCSSIDLSEIKEMLEGEEAGGPEHIVGMVYLQEVERDSSLPDEIEGKPIDEIIEEGKVTEYRHGRLSSSAGGLGLGYLSGGLVSSLTESPEIVSGIAEYSESLGLLTGAITGMAVYKLLRKERQMNLCLDSVREQGLEYRDFLSLEFEGGVYRDLLDTLSRDYEVDLYPR